MWPFSDDQCDHEWEEYESHYPKSLNIDKDGTLSISTVHKESERCIECREERYIDKTFARYEYEPIDSSITGGSQSMDHYKEEGE